MQSASAYWQMQVGQVEMPSYPVSISGFDKQKL